jgi:nanoRNase/pAp phosphatase (c-di-AMP/oligoRNAs hydrolase)
VSLRASVDELDVSAIARKWNGGGHRQAAGFSAEQSIEQITAQLIEEFAATLAPARADGLLAAPAIAETLALVARA